MHFNKMSALFTFSSGQGAFNLLLDYLADLVTLALPLISALDSDWYSILGKVFEKLI